MRGAIAMHVDVNTPYEQIMSKLTQHFNARSQMKAAESRHPVAAFGKRKRSRSVLPRPVLEDPLACTFCMSP